MITDPQHFLNDTTWKDKTIEGADFPGQPYVFKEVILNKTIKDEYLPELAKIAASKGVKLLATVMANTEGFSKGTRSYTTHNPGNIGNTNDGNNHSFPTLYDGVKGQVNKLIEIATNHNKAYQLGAVIIRKPDYDEEIARNCVNYQKSPWVPGYKFTYTGKLKEFIKIYSTSAKLGNRYMNTIISYFQQNGYVITGETTLKEIIELN